MSEKNQNILLIVRLRVHKSLFTEIAEGLPATKPFFGPETIERDKSRIFEASIGANESAFGVSPAAAKAMQNAIQSASWSDDPENFDLRKAPAEKHGV